MSDFLSPAWRIAVLASVLTAAALAQEPAVADRPAGPAAAEAGKETRTEKVELLKDGTVEESLGRKIDVGFGSVRIDGEKSDVPLSSLTADQVLAAETTKVPTPDLDADAVGGLLQLTSRRTFDQPKPTLRVSVSGGYVDLAGKLEPEASITFGRAIGKRFGFVVTGTAGQNNGRNQGVDTDWDGEGGRADLEEVALRDNLGRSREYSFNGLIDWKLAEQTAAQFRASVDREEDRGSSYAIAYRLDNRRQPATSTSEVERLLEVDQDNETSFSFAGSLAHKGDRWEIDARLSHNRRTDETVDDRRYEFRQQGVGLDYDVSDARFPRIMARPGARPDDPELSLLDEFQRNHRDQIEDDSVASLDAKWLKLPRWPGATLKVGAKFRALHTDRDAGVDVFGAAGGGIRLAEVLGGWRADDLIHGRYTLQAFADPGQMKRLFTEQPGRFVLDVDATRADTDPSSYDVKQDVFAAYAMASMPLGRRARVLAGGRMERTANNFTGYEVLFDHAGRYEATNRIGADTSYTNWFPGVHFNFAATSQLELFASWTQSIQRPGYGQLVPARRIDRSSLEIYEGNPALRPTLYTNYDLTAEYAYHASGRLALEGFHRDIEDTRLSRRTRMVGGLYDGFDRNRTENGGGARQTGFEIKWTQELGVVGALLRDFKLDTNYTHTTSTQRLENRPGDRMPLTYRPRHDLTAQLAYERHGFFGSIEMRHRSLQLDSAGSTTSEDRFRPAHTHWDVSLSYELDSHWRVFLDAENVTEEPWRLYEGVPARVDDYWLEPRRFRFGVKWEM